MTDEEQLLLNSLKLNVQQFFEEFARVENEKKETFHYDEGLVSFVERCAPALIVATA